MLLDQDSLLITYFRKLALLLRLSAVLRRGGPVSLSQFIQLFLLFFAQGTCMVYISTWSMYKNTIGALANMYLCLLVHLMWYCRNWVHCCYIPWCWPGGSRSRHAGVAMAVPSGGCLTWCPSWLTVSTEYVFNAEPQASTLLEELLPHHLCNSVTGWFVRGWGVQSYVKMQCLLHLQLIPVWFEAFFANVLCRKHQGTVFRFSPLLARTLQMLICKRPEVSQKEGCGFRCNFRCS